MAEQTPHVEPTRSATGSLAPQYFDQLYAQRADPWDFATSEYEAAKYADTLAALPRSHYTAALEIGCSIGVLTAQLAPRCERLLATEISAAALEQARMRCVHLPQVIFEQRDVATDFPKRSFDLILLSEVAYYFSQPDLEKLRASIAEALAPAGHLLLVHYTGATNYPLTADAVHETFLAWENDAWCSLRSTRTDRYRLDLLESTNTPN